MEKYYDMATHTETHKSSLTTIAATDARVAHFFEELPKGYHVEFVNDLPILAKDKVKSKDINDLMAENMEWEQYLLDEMTMKKDAWKAAGKPKYNRK